MNSLAPSPAILSSMTPRAVLDAMDKGKMRPLAAALSEEERRSIAEFITGSKLKTTSLPKSAYAAAPVFGEGQPHSQDQSGWGGDRMGTGFRTREQAGISAANVGSLTLKWAFAFPDATVMRSKPAVLGDWLIVGGQYGDVWAINRRTGKLGWHFEADAAIRGAIAVNRKREGKGSGDARGSVGRRSLRILPTSAAKYMRLMPGRENLSGVTGRVSTSNPG